MYPLRAYLSSALTNLGPETESVLATNKMIKNLLSEYHVALYLPQEYSNPNDPHSDDLSPEEVYILDRWRVAESDFLLVSADHPSFGVGQEIELAGSLGLPVVVFHEATRRVSRMLRGALSIFVPSSKSSDMQSASIIAHSSVEDLCVQLHSYLDELVENLDRGAKFEYDGADFSKLLRDAREARGLSEDELARKAGISVAFLRLLEAGRDVPRQIMRRAKLPDFEMELIHDVRFSNPGLWVVGRLAKALDMSIGSLVGEELPMDLMVERSGHFQDLCQRHDVRYREFQLLSDRFQIEYIPRVLAASDTLISEESFSRALAEIRNAGK
jgi:transcriptional regulator with XRE-family HTH domain